MNDFDWIHILTLKPNENAPAKFLFIYFKFFCQLNSFIQDANAVQKMSIV